MKLFICIILLFSFPALCIPQKRISGKIVDSLTNEPVMNATIYAGQTQVSAISDSLGRFQIKALPANSTSSVYLTHIGYNKATIHPSLVKDGMIIKLTPRQLMNENVVVKSRIRDTWEKWGKVFTSYFIGPGLESYCTLLNPYDVRFRYDKNEMRLKAFASNPLNIENRMTGFITHIDLDSFVYYFANRTVFCSMSEYFEELSPADENEKSSVAANRLLAYRGSSLHFARSFYHKILNEEGFRLYKYTGMVNPEKNRIEKLLLASMSEKERQAQSENGNTANLSAYEKDTAIYYRKVLNQPDYFFKDSVLIDPDSRWSMHSNQLAVFYFGGDTLLLKYSGMEGLLPDATLKKRATVKKAGSFSQGLYDFFQGNAGNDRYSLLYLLSGESILFRENGTIDKPGRLFTEGYFADKKRAFDLPWDYDPRADEQLLVTGKPSADLKMENIIESKVKTLAASFASTSLYLHLDKTIYDPAENIWFAGYILSSPVKNQEHNTLFVLLQDKGTGKKVSSGQFVMTDGIGAGYIYLHDSLPAGDYNLIAYTNTFTREINPVAFNQCITLRPHQEPFSVKTDDKLNSYRNDSIFILYKLLTEQKGYATEMRVNYRLTAGGETVSKGRTVTNKMGEISLNGLPVNRLAGKELLLCTDVIQKKDTFRLRNKVTILINYLRIRWFPEGGELVNGLPARLPFEITEPDGHPVNVKAVLYADNDSIAMISTNGPGAGYVNITPQSGKKYSVRLLTEGYQLVDHFFPAVYADGCTIHAEKGVVEDSLRITIRSAEKSKKLFLAVHNNNSDFYVEKIMLRNGETSRNIPAALVPPGLAAITLFDSSGTPLAERSIFREPPDQFLLKIETDSAAYHNKSKVRVRLKATDKDGNPVQSILSLSCALKSRVDINRFQDIVSFSFFNNNAAKASADNKIRLYEYNRLDAERFLSVQGWTHYKWREQPAIKTHASIYGILTVQRGQVLRNGEYLAEPVELLVVTPESIQIVRTNDKGYFELPAEMITTLPDRKITLAVNSKKQKEYQILLASDNEKLMQQLAAQKYPVPVPGIASVEEDGGPFVQTLSTVVVQAKNFSDDDFFKKRIKLYRTVTDSCLDYVCMYNFLNCQNHPGGVSPQPGMYYYIHTSTGDKFIYYKGCVNNLSERAAKQYNDDPDPFTAQFSGRYYSKEFYVADYEKYNPPFPETHSTVYWNPLIRTGEKGEAELSFYTNDLSGRFILTAEGITGNGVLSDKKIFRVLK